MKTDTKPKRRRWTKLRSLTGPDAQKRMQKRRDQLRKGFLAETTLKNRTAADALATAAANAQVQAERLSDRAMVADLIGDEVKAMSALIANAKRLMDQLGVTAPRLEDPEDDL